MFTGKARGLFRFALAALLAAGIPAELRAQTTSASVTGSIQDPQGGVLPGVTVTLTSNTQGNVLTAVTDDTGRFVFAIVRPDTYSLAGHAAGFQDAPSGRTLSSTRTTNSPRAR